MDALVELPGDRLVLGGGEVLLRRPTDRRAVAQGRAGSPPACRMPAPSPGSASNSEETTRHTPAPRQ